MFSYHAFEALCKIKGKTVRRVALESGVATSTLSNWKLGKYEPKANKIKQLADYFGVEFERLLDNDSGAN